MIVHAGAHHAELRTVAGAGDAEAIVGQIDKEIFDLSAPVRSNAEFTADAEGPANIGVGFRQAEGLAVRFAERQTASAVEQDVAEGVADPAARRSKPGVGELPGRERIFGTADLDVAFHAEHQRTRLPIVAALDTALQARRIGRIVVDRAPGPAEIGAEVRTRPAIGIERLV